MEKIVGTAVLQVLVPVVIEMTSSGAAPKPTDDSWGVQWSPRIAHGEYRCAKRGCSFVLTDSLGRFEDVVGYSTCCPPRSGDRTADSGCIIKQCPVCLKCYWHHIDAVEKRMYKLSCPNWPKAM